MRNKKNNIVLDVKRPAHNLQGKVEDLLQKPETFKAVIQRHSVTANRSTQTQLILKFDERCGMGTSSVWVWVWVCVCVCVCVCVNACPRVCVCVRVLMHIECWLQEKDFLEHSNFYQHNTNTSMHALSLTHCYKLQALLPVITLSGRQCWLNWPHCMNLRLHRADSSRFWDGNNQE